MPLLETRGSASTQGFGALSSGAVVNYIEDVFSTFLYTGNGSTQTITNGVDLSGKGGLVWLKSRSAATSHVLTDTARGYDQSLFSNASSAQSNNPNRISGFNTNGFGLGNDAATNTNADTYASWTFRKQPKFFDVVTYTGDGSSSNVINHSLGTTVGCAIIKCTSNSSTNWIVYHRSMLADNVLKLNTTDAKSSNASFSSTSTTFTVQNFNTVADNTNESGRTYVAYLFAHDAGGFGLTGTDNVISCGSFSSPSGSSTSINLGFEPQWVLWKATSTTDDWAIADNMRGFQGGSPTGSNSPTILRPNTSGTEGSVGQFMYLEPTGFNVQSGVYSVGTQFIYIAIRRGPMKTPTTGTSVYTGITRTGTGANATVTGAGFPVDLLLSGSRNAAFGTIDFDRLRGATQRLFTYSTAAEAARSTSLTSFAVQDGYTIGDDATDGGLNNSGQTYIYWNFRRAPGFFDVVCYTGTGSNLTLNHNLGVAPELMIIKARSASSPWAVYAASEGINKTADLNRGDLGFYTETGRWLATPTATEFSVKPGATLNSAGQTQVAYLFATVAGVSKIGTYTGTGATQTISCGFTGGARFVLIKRTDSTGDWYVWDSARGIVAGNDPYLLLNSTAAEVTNTDFVDTFSSGFEISSTAPAAINASGGTFIYLAIA